MTQQQAEEILNDFREWLQRLPANETEATDSPTEMIDLHTLLGQFLAVKQEVNLQTKAVRAQQEQSAETLEKLSETLETLKQTQADAQSRWKTELDSQIRPVLESMMDLYDSLALGQREAQRVSEEVLPLLQNVREQQAGEPVALPSITLPEMPEQRGSFLGRLFGSSGSSSLESWKVEAQQKLREALERHQQAQIPLEELERIEKLLSSLLTGYTMSLQRIDRALSQHAIQPISCVGEAFDPDFMKAMDIVMDSELAPGTVVEMVRRGYQHEGKAIRFAEVIVSGERTVT